MCTPGIPATSQLPRLTRAEYDKTTRDLLGLDVQPSTMLAPDTLGSVDQRAWDGFQTAADSLATAVIASTTARAKVLPCTTDNATCIGQFITAFGQKALPSSAHDDGGGALPGAVHEPRDDHAEPEPSIRRCS